MNEEKTKVDEVKPSSETAVTNMHSGNNAHPTHVSNISHEHHKPTRNWNINWKSKELWFVIGTIVILIAILVMTVWMRTQNVSNLKDITTGQYTLGPDLDPFLYLRHANEIVQGKLQDPDMMRMAPLGTPNYATTNLMPWAIVFIYRILDIFFDVPIASVEFAAIIAPVIFFSVTLLLFFFFVRALFSLITSKKSATIIALIATFFYAIIPEMLHRTTAGIPEIESLGMVFFWGAFLFFLYAWKQENIKKIVLFGVLSGIFTGLMIFTWGGYHYIFMTFSLVALLFLSFDKQKKKNLLVFTSWLIPSLIINFAKTPTLASFTSITDTFLGIMVFAILIVDLILFNTKLKTIKDKIKLPEGIISIIVTVLISLILLLIVSPSTIPQTFSKIIEGLLYPFGRGRIGLTVAENRAPYFTEVFGSFGLFFWVFFFGTILFFYEATKHFKKKKKIWLNVLFIIFLLTFIFSRISPQSVLNGENTLSRIFYFGGLLVFTIFIFYIYIKAYKKQDYNTLNSFREINFSYILILAFVFWMIVSMRGAVRLFFIISPALIIVASFFPVKIGEYSLKAKDDLYKIILWCIVIIATIALIIVAINYVKSTSQQAKYTVLGPYYQQWMRAMAWVRENTPEDAIFVHWWDYGYWIQTLGQRATVTDGGHANGFWDHTTARYLMTAENEKTALQLCKAHNVSYYLIDSTDIGKYGAYSSIGSDSTGEDRLSWLSTFVLDETQTKEEKNITSFVYVGGGVPLDQDITWKEQLLPRNKAIIVGFIMTVEKESSTIQGVNMVVYNNKQYTRVPIKYVYINNKLYTITNDSSALNSALYLVPRLTQKGLSNIGTALYLSEKLINSEMVRLYLLNQTNNFELVHTEPSPFIQQLREIYNITVGDFLYTNELNGPIKIWKVNYPEDIEYYKEYLQVKSPEGHWAELDYLGT